MTEVKIRTIRIDIGQVKVDLTMEQVKELHSILGEMFAGKDYVVVPCPQPIPMHWYYDHWALPTWNGTSADDPGVPTVTFSANSQ